LESMDLIPLSPTKPVAAWMGGKRLLAAKITTIIDKTPHTLYGEPFTGMGGVFFRRTMKPKAEVMNDIAISWPRGPSLRGWLHRTPTR
jgi:DNA adenine methylase